MENRKGSGVFLGVVSIATLVVAIIGATFAYFSASTNSANDAVNLQAYEFDVRVTDVERVYPTTEALLTANDLIPLNPTTTVGTTGTSNLIYALNDAENKCVDSRGYQVCALYKVTLANGGNQAVDLSLTVKTTKNDAAKDSEGQPKAGRTGFQDLKFQVLNLNEEDYEIATKLVEESQVAIAAAGLMPTAQQSVTIDGYTATAAVGNSEHYFVVYLDEPVVDLDGEGEGTETGPKDQSAQMGATFEGELIYTTTTAGGVGNTLTGTFVVE